jgi:hypothetical protein
MYYTTSRALECLVVREPKHRNSGISGAARHKLLRPETVRQHRHGGTFSVLRQR